MRAVATINLQLAIFDRLKIIGCPPLKQRSHASIRRLVAKRTTQRWFQGSSIASPKRFRGRANCFVAALRWRALAIFDVVKRPREKPRGLITLNLLRRGYLIRLQGSPPPNIPPKAPPLNPRVFGPFMTIGRVS